MHSLPLITILGSLVRWFANDFHSWLRHLWKSLANHLTREQNSLFTVTHALLFISPLLTHWGCCSLALSHWFTVTVLLCVLPPVYFSLIFQDNITTSLVPPGQGFASVQRMIAWNGVWIMWIHPKLVKEPQEKAINVRIFVGINSIFIG